MEVDIKVVMKLIPIPAVIIIFGDIGSNPFSIKILNIQQIQDSAIGLKIRTLQQSTGL